MPTKTQLENEINTRKVLDAEREISDERYAIKLVERIVFGICLVIFSTMLYFIIAWLVGKGLK